MSAKRAREGNEDAASGLQPEFKKPRKGFRVGPDNLPDGPWRRKNDKLKQNLITQAKTKKQYAKIKAQHQQEEAARKAPASVPVATGEGAQDEDAGNAAEQPDAQIHPDRQAMLDGEDGDLSGAPQGATQNQDSNPNPYPHRDRDRRPRREPRGRARRPGYFDKSLEQAAQKRAEAETRAKEAADRQAEWQRRVAERERHRKAMAKAKTPGVDGKLRLGRESKLLLEKVKRLVGDKK